jgi:hypothetical protein
MSGKRQLWIQRVRDIEGEWRAARSALRLLREQLRADPGWGKKWGWSQVDAAKLERNIDVTFMTRLYAEFESSLRDYWRVCTKKDTHPPMIQLLNSVAGRRHVPRDLLDDAHEVREYRNWVVHERAEGPPREVPLDEAKKALCKFLSNLPFDW